MMTINDPRMHCLSVKNPWAYLICAGVKQIEYRSRNTSFRGTIHIHVSGEGHTTTDAFRAEPNKLLWRSSPKLMHMLREARGDPRAIVFPSGRIIGSVELVDVERYDDVSYGWILDKAQFLDKPLDGIKGRMGLWTYEPSSPVESQESVVNDYVSYAAAEPEDAAEPSEPYRANQPFLSTDFHAKAWAWSLDLKSSAPDYGTIAGTMIGARVDLNPHQIDAAIFALKSPIARGALLADEVGLGKTIEAGIVIAQKWAEGRKKILLILPASLRQQWLFELAEKFFLPSIILEKRGFDRESLEGSSNPFDRPGEIVIASYQFASSKASNIKAVPWDLIVVDEAHRIRNSWRKGNVTGQALRNATDGRRKLLLTATPLQNNMMELFGLLSFIDPRAFGDEASFKLQYSRLAEAGRYEELRARIAPFCKRTLRRQVTEYVKYTSRICLTETFEPGEDERSLYDDISSWLQRPELVALPMGQRHLMTLIMRKLLASSTYAIAGALDTIIARLLAIQEGIETAREEEEDFDEWEEELEEWNDEDIPAPEIDPVELSREIDELKGFRTRARAIRENAKGQRLMIALARGFEELDRLGAERKAIIFTESRKTQAYLLEVLADSPYGTGIVLFNGTNLDKGSRAVYSSWLDANRGTDRISGSPSADMRAALVDCFRERGTIMIATEAAAEGINLQFCSLVINFDLPWNPQRIEQRIGRCHRYGQKHDVVVLNFLNIANRADQRVYELLSEKLKLFSGVFGASDDILGSLGSGVDLEQRILAIYQHCRGTQEIDEAFDQLREEFSEHIDATMRDTKRKLMENLDDEVRQRLKITDNESILIRNIHERSLFYLLRHLSPEPGSYDERSFSFSESGESYRFDEYGEGRASLVRLGMDLARERIRLGKALEPKPARILFEYHGGSYNSAAKALIGKSGYLAAYAFRSICEEAIEERLLYACVLDDGSLVPTEQASKLFQESGRIIDRGEEITFPLEIELQAERLKIRAREEAQERSRSWLSVEIDKLDAWAEDLKAGLELKIKEVEAAIKQVRKEKTLASSLESKLGHERRYKELERERNSLRRRLFDAQDEIDARRDEVIESIEKKLKANEETLPLFKIAFSVLSAGPTHPVPLDL